ncbi:hypothetical protein VCRA2114E365_20235 [Vibrio crassostreae]|uniref:Uncharacterized protein n=2 Tax=Vibrio crassostreae TaxID=246167 RepID=A0A822MTQ6_9VIBR|nr:hypothetical protein VCRA2117O378_10236 [Vibrio crassostreae]CAK1852597.1 hypothetical protein VCRA2113O356_10252 [Vibrio crassostreae]CAK1855676.1 hypothetical protein VCRA2116O28_10238 [Vibrio crassostreae]CAK1856698.1 hypothetical protein VCRA2116O27_10239 [Vibrio crassostreae]CAK1858780.1 hypothetical protein VCRA2117O38_10238 [Vibrio crassostreae]
MAIQFVFNMFDVEFTKSEVERLTYMLVENRWNTVFTAQG